MFFCIHGTINTIVNIEWLIISDNNCSGCFAIEDHNNIFIS